MPAGLTIYNTSNTIQLSSELKNPALIQSGNMTTGTNTISGAPFANSMASLTYTRASTDHHPILAIRPSGKTAFVGIDNPSALTQTWYFLSESGTGVDIPYWLFDIKTVDASNYFEIYDASGNRALSLVSKPMRLRDIITGTTSLINTNFTYESGRTYAAVLSRWSENLLYRSLPNVTDQRVLTVTGITDGIQVSAYKISESPGNTTPSPATERQVLVLDVTNY